MSEDSSPPPSAPTPASNQNLIIGLVFGAGVILLFILVLNLRGNGSSGDSAEVAALRQELDNRRALVNEERRRLGLSPLGTDSSGQSVEALAARISNDSTDLVAIVRQMQILLQEKEARLANIDTQFDALTSQNTTLRNQLNQLQATAQDIETFRQRAAQAEALYESAKTRIADLQDQLTNTASSSEMASLRQQLELALTQRDQYGRELAALQAELKGLQVENVKLYYELQEVRSELSKTRLFADSVDQLPLAAKALFARLAKYETISGAQLATEYQSINTDLRARVVDTISFPTGSSQINQDKAEETRRALQASGNNSFFLIVGYASKTGSFDKNRDLSSERATTIASIVDYHKMDTQNVMGVFLSQTDRFSPSDPLQNQICEIWEIKE